MWTEERCRDMVVLLNASAQFFDIDPDNVDWSIREALHLIDNDRVPPGMVGELVISLPDLGQVAWMAFDCHGMPSPDQLTSIIDIVVGGLHV